jgi:N-acetylated-alpha-linked acidic dipeptidase
LKQVLVLALLLAGRPAPPAAVLRGFSPERSDWQRSYEKRFLALPQPEECGAILRELTRTPHVAGTPGNARVADFLAAEYRKAGFEVETPTYDVLLSYPKSARLELIGEPGVALGRGEEPIASDPDTAIPEAAIPWTAYAPSAEVTGDVVYVNRGEPEDYDRLARLGVRSPGTGCAGALLRRIPWRKSLEAEARRPGAAGVLGPHRRRLVQVRSIPTVVDPNPLQRGASAYDFIVPGDP